MGQKTEKISSKGEKTEKIFPNGQGGDNSFLKAMSFLLFFCIFYELPFLDNMQIFCLKNPLTGQKLKICP
jgi:hypothetical protein